MKISLPFLSDDQILQDPISLSSCSTDASFYSLRPKAIIDPKDSHDVINILNSEVARNIGVTIRAAGTSLSGQAQGDGLILRLSKGWKNKEVLEKGNKIKLQPGVIGWNANLALAPYFRKIGPDPASIKSCMIGGILANNASGMCCGTHQNSYQTMESVKFIMPPRINGEGEEVPAKEYDSGIGYSRVDFFNDHRDLCDYILEKKKFIEDSPELIALIRKKYEIKNTMGYSLNSFLDYNDPVDIFTHLLIGSEGTLAFASEVTYRTVEEYPYRCCALLFFKDIEKACATASILSKERIVSAELMDRASLRSIEDKPGVPDYLKSFDPNACALLVEVRSNSDVNLEAEKEYLQKLLSQFELIREPEVSTDSSVYMKWWDIRKGLLPSVGKQRKTGTTLIIEDIAFSLENLAPATMDLLSCLKEYGYDEAILFGHALNGNLHFVFAQDFNNDQEVARYSRFMDALGELVAIKWKGSLKAEHGTGRNMAPYVLKEWGDVAYSIMTGLKKLTDTYNILGRGVIINESPKAHIENLKLTPAVDELIDNCIDCGYCESHCPSRNLSLTPRQRISLFRRALSYPEKQRQELFENMDYDFNQTCATDGLCATACPVDIDTGKFVKKMRKKNRSPFANSIASFLLANKGIIYSALRFGLSLLSIIPQRILDILARFKGLSFLAWMPRGAKKIKVPISNPEGTKVVYVPSCITRTFGAAKKDRDQRSVPEAMISLLKRYNFDIIIPERIGSLCCGLSFESKGFFDQANQSLEEMNSALTKASQQGKIPIVMDMSPCSYRLKESLQSLPIYDSIDFIDKFINLNLKPLSVPIAIHPTCSTEKMGLKSQLKSITEKCTTKKVIIPEDIGCCAFAGDKGFTHEELNDSALSGIKNSVKEADFGVCNSRTCEIGISKNSEKSYQSLIHLVDQITVDEELKDRA